MKLVTAAYNGPGEGYNFMTYVTLHQDAHNGLLDLDEPKRNREQQCHDKAIRKHKNKRKAQQKKCKLAKAQSARENCANMDDNETEPTQPSANAGTQFGLNSNHGNKHSKN